MLGQDYHSQFRTVWAQHVYTHSDIQVLAQLIVFQWNNLACFTDLPVPSLYSLPSVLVLLQGGKEQLVSRAVTYFQHKKDRSRQNCLKDGKTVLISD